MRRPRALWILAWDRGLQWVTREDERCLEELGGESRRCRRRYGHGGWHIVLSGCTCMTWRWSGRTARPETGD